jgi:cell division septation protein DedD
MENKPKGTKTITNLLSKTVGLIFFSFLAISLGVVFGLLFDGWVKDQPGTPVGTENNNLQTVDLPSEKQPAITGEENTTKNLSSGDDSLTKPVENLTVKPLTTVKFKVRVGPYPNRDQALAASTQLQSLGYPVYVGNSPPFAVQVGAFATQTNADRLKNELTGRGYKVFVEKSQ